MPETKPYTIKIKFPGDNEYIPAVRKFVSDLLLAGKFSQKCAFRSEIIIDEICNNAVAYGCPSSDSCVELTCLLYKERIEFLIKDSGGSVEHINRLRTAVESSGEKAMTQGPGLSAGLGLEIVRMLAEEVNMVVDENNITSIRVVRRREDPCVMQGAKN
jgi:anti-sigma regulatory factor (Ser/Thr protein kinase)